MTALSNLVQLVLGAAIGFSLLGLVGAGAGYLFFSRLAVTPDRPVFAEELSSGESPPAAAPTTSPAAETSETAAAELEPEEELEPGTYRMRVTWPDGLSLRAEPALEAEAIGGIAYDEIMIVLESSDDGRWDRVRLSGSDETGWVKSGNAERID